MAAVEFSVDPDHSFRDAVQEAIEKTGDLTVPFMLIAKRWFTANKFIFTLKGPGKYVDLSPKYKKWKTKKKGSPYPILKLNGYLERSITDPADTNAINYIVNKTTLILGTKVSYASAHQFGIPSRNLPARPPILIGVANSGDLANQREISIWNKILLHHIQTHAKFGSMDDEGEEG